MAVQVNRAENPYIWARVVNLLLGVWLFISAFVWPHTAGERLETWILGICIVVFSLVAMSYQPARWLNTLAAIALFFATLAVPHSNIGTMWNNIIIAVVVFLLSFVGGMEGMRRVGGVRGPVGT